MSAGEFAGRYPGWKVTRVELAIAALLPVLGSVVGVVQTGSNLLLAGTWIPRIGAGLVARGGVGAVRGEKPAEWLRTVGVEYVFLGTTNGVATGRLTLAFWSGFDRRVAVALLASAVLSTVFLGRGGWFVSVTRPGSL